VYLCLVEWVPCRSFFLACPYHLVIVELVPLEVNLVVQVFWVDIPLNVLLQKVYSRLQLGPLASVVHRALR
jgi:hypothetical protein